MRHELTVPPDAVGERLDRFLESRLDGTSRSLIQRLIKEGACTVVPGKVKPGLFLKGGERVVIEVPKEEPETIPQPEDLPLSVVYEDEQLVVIDKVAGMLVHPAPGHLHGTLVSALLHRYGRTLGGDPWRPGIVHRLDQETSGLIVAARTDAVHEFLQEAWKERRVLKRYLALVSGQPRADVFDHTGAIGRHPRDFRRRAVLPLGEGDAKEAYTSFQVLHRDSGWSAVEARPRTGRTHQIRVHLAALGHPVLADNLYGHAPGNTLTAARTMTRHALHAWTLDLPHPDGRTLSLSAPIPKDMADFMPIVPEPRVR